MSSIRTLASYIAPLIISPLIRPVYSATLVPFAYDPLPLGSITANGWLQTELETLGNGLGGHLHDFWPYVARSTWTGGTIEYSVLNEALPYWVNALVPLAYTLDDARLKAQVHDVVGTVLDRIQPDGWIGPETLSSGKRMIWARTLFFLGVTNLADANATWTEPIVTAMQNFNVLMNQMLNDNGTGLIYHDGSPLDPGDFTWFLSRTEDMIVSLEWLLDKFPGNIQDTILDNIRLLHHFGAKWEDWFVEGTYIKEDLYDLPESVTDDNWDFLHGVTAAEGLKAPSVIRRWTMNDSLIQIQKNGVDWTFQYHGSASGTILADERIDGLNPYYGSELCTDVETIYSLAYVYHAIGDPDYADKAELAAFNALPAAVAGDWWSHQYMTQPNQPFSKNLSDTPFWDVNTLGQTFGLEPNYPCCTVNHPQGYPKFTMYSYALVGDNGLIHSLLGPTNVNTQLSSGKVSVTVQTNYPFDDVLDYQIQSDGAFDFYVRVPTWSNQTTIAVSGNQAVTNMDPESRLRKISVGAGTTSFSYTIDTGVRTVARANDTIAVYRGSLLYAIHIPAITTSGPPKHAGNESVYAPGSTPPQSHDFTMLNATEWNIAIDPTTITYDRGAPAGTPLQLPNPTFADGALPMSMSAKACLINWPLFKNVVPGSPIPLKERTCLGDTFTTTLVPYGSAKLHMAEIPVITLT